MSIVIYKDGKASHCEPNELEYQLKAGFSLESKPKKQAQKASPKSKPKENFWSKIKGESK